MANRDRTPEKIRQIAAVIDATRALFHRMKVTAEQVHREAEVTAAQGSASGPLSKRAAHRSGPGEACKPPAHSGALNRLLERGEVDLIPNPGTCEVASCGSRMWEERRSRRSAAERPGCWRVSRGCCALAEAAKVLRDLKAAFEDPSLIEQGQQ